MERPQAAQSAVGRRKTALLVVDVQNDFCPGGALAVPDGDSIVPSINRLARDYANVVLTQDWHPAGHASFASSHPGCSPYEQISLSYGPQVLWPDHCVQGTSGAEFHPALDIPHARLILRKGIHKGVDSYSAFQEADRTSDTGLGGYLRSLGVDSVDICGLATDFCVAWTALDARAAGFKVRVLLHSCRAIDLNGSLAAAQLQMSQAGCDLITNG
ncbi:bifunctional nicotinamidase/pyrazinamidase [Lacibacterium aquatile]|uniref:nicotinamidase n=1 Tax=Lacibacterium aquatile TaxID=1168082 RepID=A0ABW5DP03_9PROT